MSGLPACKTFAWMLVVSMLWPIIATGGEAPIDLEVVSPIPLRANSQEPDPIDRRSIQFRAGWPLTLRLTVSDHDMLGIGSFGRPLTDEYSVFPEINQGGAIVFENPDDCYFTNVTSGCGAPDEVQTAFYPDREIRGVEDDTGYRDQQIALASDAARPAYGGPTIYGEWSHETESIRDGWGWGADDDIPGLVILANVGPSIVRQDENYDPSFTPGSAGFFDEVSPARVRNSAGFMTMVGYELNTTKKKTSITASMLVPRHLYSHTRLIDLCTGDWYFDEDAQEIVCDGDAIQRIESGPIEPYDEDDRIDTEVELRAFVVASHVGSSYEAIDELEDQNGDGKVTAADAALAGYVVLSNEVVIGFTQISNSTGECNGTDTPTTGDVFWYRNTNVYVDIDGNGTNGAVSSSCPPGSGGMAEPPRR